MSLQVLPLAVTMVAGPVIMAAIVFVTSAHAVRVSVAYVAGVALAVCVGVALARALASLVGEGVSFGSSADAGSAGSIVQFALVAVLIGTSVRTYIGRTHAEPPRWLGSLLEAPPRKALGTGLLLVLLGPSDLVAMLTVGANLEHGRAPLVDALPFVAATVLLTALPLLGYLVLHRQAVRAMPKVRDWMSANSWLVNIAVSVVFIALILWA